MVQMKKVFITEFAKELNEFREYCNKSGIDSSKILVVALEPQVKVACKEKGMDYVDTLPFFYTVSHKRVLTKSHELTTLISENLSFDVTPSVNKVFMDTFIFYSRFYINNYLWIIEVMKGIKQAYEEIEVFVFKREVTGKNITFPSMLNPYLSKQDRFVGSLVEKYCRENGLKTNVIKEEETGTAAGDRKTVPGVLENLLKGTARKLYKKKLNRLSRFPVVFVTAPSYNLDRVCGDIQAAFPNVLAVTDLQGTISTRGYLKLCLKQLKEGLLGRDMAEQLIKVPVHLFKPGQGKAGGGLRKVKEAYKTFAANHLSQFIYENCSLWEEFNQKVETDLLPATAGLLDTAQSQRTFLEYLKPKLVISPVSTGEYQSWAEVSHSLSIPALVIPQKTLVKPSNPFAKIEERYIGRAQVTDIFDNAAAQSPLVKEYLKWSGYKGNIIESGNLIFARHGSGERKARRKVIVWAPSMKTRKSRRFYVLESIDELTSAMEDVFAVVSRIKDVHLVFRIHPGDAITKEEIYSLLPVPANVSVSDTGVFEDVLALADLLISFSSTAAQEALINHIPILLYDKWKRYNHLDAVGIKNGTPAKVAAAYYIDEKEHLASSIKWILEEHTKKEVPPDIFKEYAFLANEKKFDNFLNFVEQCIE